MLFVKLSNELCTCSLVGFAGLARKGSLATAFHHVIMDTRIRQHPKAWVSVAFAKLVTNSVGPSQHQIIVRKCADSTASSISPPQVVPSNRSMYDERDSLRQPWFACNKPKQYIRQRDIHSYTFNSHLANLSCIFLTNISRRSVTDSMEQAVVVVRYLM